MQTKVSIIGGAKMEIRRFEPEGFFQIIFQTTNKLSIKAITKENLPHFFGFIFSSLWLYTYFLPMGSHEFQIKLLENIVNDTSIYFYAMLISCSLVPLFLDGRLYVPASFYSVIVSLICYSLALFLEPGFLSKVALFIAVPCMGHIYISHIYSFFMILNNSEKLSSMIVVIFLSKVLKYARPLFNFAYFKFHPSIIFIYIILFALALSTYYIRSDVERIPSLQKIKAPKKAYSLMPVAFITLALNDVIAPVVLQQISNLNRSQLQGYYFYGILAGLVMVLLMQVRFSMNICFMLNFSFAFLEIGFVTSIINMQYPSAGFVSAACFGVAYSTGIVNTCYLAGFMIKKFQSIYFYLTCLLLSASCYLITSAFVQLLSIIEIQAMSSIITTFISICIIILFFYFRLFLLKCCTPANG
jgi:hypothetical protein